MNEILNNLYNFIMTIINGSSWYGPLIACLLIFLESIIPVLPLFVFITIVFIAFGYIPGFLISYLLTCFGCFFSFYLCRRVLMSFFEKKVRKIENINKLMKFVDNISLKDLTLLIAIPFTPAFLINILSSLSKMEFKKFAISVFIGKIFLVFFWGFIGTSLLESLKNPKILLIILIMLFIAYLLSRLVTKKFNIK